MGSPASNTSKARKLASKAQPVHNLSWQAQLLESFPQSQYVKSRWKNIRSVYAREKSSGREETSVWPLFHDCQWYNPYMRKLNNKPCQIMLSEIHGFADSGIKHDPMTDTYSNMGPQYSAGDPNSPADTNMGARKRTHSGSQYSEQSDHQQHPHSHQHGHSDNSKRLNMERINMERLNMEPKDECSYFGIQVASYLRKLPAHTTLEAKADVLKTLSKYFTSDK